MKESLTVEQHVEQIAARLLVRIGHAETWEIVKLIEAALVWVQRETREQDARIAESSAKPGLNTYQIARNEVCGAIAAAIRQQEPV